MAAFHKAPWPERAEVVETFEDDRLQELGRRLVFLETPEALHPHRRKVWEAWLQNRRQGREGVAAGRTVGDAFAELEQIGPSRSEALAEIGAWLEGLDLAP